MTSAKNVFGMTTRASTITTTTSGRSHLVQSSVREDVTVTVTSSNGKVVKVTKTTTAAEDAAPSSPSSSSGTTLESQSLSPAEIERHFDFDYENSSYEGEEVRNHTVLVQKVVREEGKMDIKRSSLVDGNLNGIHPNVTVSKKHEMGASTLTSGVRNYEYSQHFSPHTDYRKTEDAAAENRKGFLTSNNRKMNIVHDTSKTRQLNFTQSKNAHGIEIDQTDKMIILVDDDKERERVKREITNSLEQYWQNRTPGKDAQVVQGNKEHTTSHSEFQQVTHRKSNFIQTDSLTSAMKHSGSPVVQRNEVTHRNLAKSGNERQVYGQWQVTETDDLKAPRKQILLAKDESNISENDPIQRTDVVRALDANVKSEVIQLGYTRNLLGQWKDKENEEYKVVKRQIVLDEAEGKISENDPIQRTDVVRALDANVKSEVIQLGYTRNLLGQWKDKENEEYKVVKRQIVLEEAEGMISENDPIQRTDVVRESDAKMKAGVIEFGYSRNLHGQRKSQDVVRFRDVKRKTFLSEVGDNNISGFPLAQMPDASGQFGGSPNVEVTGTATITYEVHLQEESKHVHVMSS